jgi:hypothetical protein
MTDILVDSNVILDILTEDPQWFEGSAQKLIEYANQGELIVNRFTASICDHRHSS